jgi:hypothetical protein
MEVYKGAVTEKGGWDSARRGHAQAGEALQRAGTETRRPGRPYRFRRSPLLSAIAFKAGGDLTTPRKTNKISYL